MYTVKISTGATVTMKSKVNRGLRKKINSALNMRFIGKKGKGDQMEMEMKEFSKADQDSAHDVIVLGMIEKIVDKEGKELSFDQEFIDNMDEDDFDLVLAKADEITAQEVPKG